MNNKKQLMAFAILTMTISTFAQVKDIDNNLYQTVMLNKNIWMAENLHVSRFRNGDTIPEAKTVEEWENAGLKKQPAWCYYENNPQKDKTYGKLYNRFAVTDLRGLAPEGWRVTQSEDWLSSIMNYFGPESSKILKAKNGWNAEGNGTNKSGFTGLPGGYRDNNGVFNDVGYHGYWWTTSSWYFLLRYNTKKLEMVNSFGNYGMSVRCIKD
jgi:uncharacterized protein (TIGR02145 family)